MARFKVENNNIDAVKINTTRRDNKTIQLGTGARPRPDGVINTDAEPMYPGIFKFKIEDLHYLDPDQFCEVIAEHCLEHFNVNSIKEILAQVYRILKPGGVIKVSVPNMQNYFKNGEVIYKVLGWADVNEWVYGPRRSGRHNDVHKAAMSPDMLQELVSNAGFKAVRILNGKDYGDYHVIEYPPISDEYKDPDWRTIGCIACK